MPELKAPQPLQRFDLQTEPYLDPKKKLPKEAALALVVDSYNSWGTWRQASQEPKWEEASNLYLGKIQQKSWDAQGRYPRSAVPMRIVYAHSATVATKITTSIFGRQPFWFDLVDPNDPIGANQLRQQLSGYLETPNENGISSVAHMKKAIQNHFVPLGTAMGQVGWDTELDKPFLRHLDPRKVYISPRTRISAETTPAWILREEMSVRDILALDKKLFTIPSKAELHHFATNKTDDFGAQLIGNEQAELGLIQTSIGTEPNPLDATVEILAYESPERIIWVLNREWVLYSVPNPYQFMTLVMANYSDTDVSPYGEGIGALVGPEQHLQQTILNTHIDQVALNLNPVRVRAKAMNVPEADRVFRPGLEITVTNPKDDYQVHQIGNVTGESITIVGMSDMRASKLTGMSNMAQSGTPTPSNANRTASGVSSQSAASSERILTPLENFESFYIIPALKKMTAILNMVNGDPNQTPRDFKMFGTSRLTAPERLTPVLPLLMQHALNPELPAKMQAVGQTVDYQEINRLIGEATGTSEKYRIFRPLNQQETQQAQAPDGQQQRDMQVKQMELQAKAQIADGQNKTKVEIERMKSKSKEHEVAEESASRIAQVLLKAREKDSGPK